MQVRDELLIAEYNHSTEVANHIDNVRNAITSFFLTLNGGVLVVTSLVVKGEVREDEFGSPGVLLAGLLVTVFVLGTIFTATVARLRRVQTERYRIANRVLDYVLGDDGRQVIPLANASLSNDAGGAGLNKRMTGNYFWTLAIMLPTAALAGIAVYVIMFGIHDLRGGSWRWPLTLAAGVLAFVLEDQIYFALSKFTTDEAGANVSAGSH